ncbi:MAG: S8 family serine peptidase [Myxococcota bacterium]
MPTDFELGPGAHVATSYWSPVLCATVARVVGPPGASPEALVTQLPESAVLAANEVYVTAAPEVTPAPAPAPTPTPEVEVDPYRPLQYALDRAGVEAARAVTDGRGVTVAILDSAPALPHRDLASVTVAAADDAQTRPPGVHGTLLAGIVGATENNGFGIAGIAPGASVVSVPVCTPEGATARDRCLLFDLLRGLDVAWNHEAQVVNLSLVGPSSPLLERAVARLDSLGVVTVAAAGNEGSSAPRYPAAYPTVVGVAAVDRDGRLWDRSNRGLSAEIAAPGVGILSTTPGDAFAFGDGTSLAAAQVSGLLALLTSASGDPLAARRALFRAGHAADHSVDPATAGVAPLCRSLQLLGRPCRPERAEAPAAP